MNPNFPTPQIDVTLGHQAIASLTQYYVNLINFLGHTAQHNQLAAQAQLAAEKDAHVKTKLELEAQLAAEKQAHAQLAEAYAALKVELSEPPPADAG